MDALSEPWMGCLREFTVKKKNSDDGDDDEEQQVRVHHAQNQKN